MESIEKTQQPSESLDARWYKRFESIAFEDYEKLAGEKEHREQQKRQFLSGEIENPELGYPELETFAIEDKEAELLSLKEDVLELEENQAVRKIYRTKINESIATVRMLRAAKEGDDRKFSRYADFIYGKPTESDSNYVLQQVQQYIADNIDSSNPDRVAAAQHLDLFFGDMDIQTDGEGVGADILPDGEDIEGVVESLDEVVEAFEDALDELNIDDWEVVVDTEKGLTNFSVSQEHKIVRIPEEEKLLARNISKKKLKGLIAHEIHTHVARRHNGERSKLHLLGLGLDRYIQAEEGIATFAEQQVVGAKEFAGVPRYFSVMVAKGVDGVPRDFHHTFSIMKSYRVLTSTKPDITDKDVENIAYNDCVRIFRGTTCETPGAVYPKDMAYFGNRKIWTLVSKNSEAVQYFSVGKYDPTNPGHVGLLSELGILESDLEKLES